MGGGARGGGRGKRAQAPPLGSIAAGAGGDKPFECPQCGGTTATQVAMTLGDGTDVTFVSCQGCEHRTWVLADGTELTIEDVLARSNRKQ